MTGKLFYIFLPLLVTLSIAQFLLSNDLASTGNSVFEVEQSIKVLREENEILKQQVASARSLSAIEDRANELGFAAPSGFVTVPLYENMAYR